MRFIAVLALFLLTAPSVLAADPPVLLEISLNMEMLVRKAIADRLISGAVVIVGDSGGPLLQESYGHASAFPEAPPLTGSEIFDIASLTKVVATAPAVMKLAEQGRLSLVDPVAAWFPEFGGEEWNDLLVMNLLTHTSGLDDISCMEGENTESFIARAGQQKPKGEIGTRFRYADINFIILGELVHRASGVPLDSFSQASLYQPMGMRDTTFNPGGGRFVPTLLDERTLLAGRVQDLNARRLGGVAGHAGLFSTPRDLALFCGMILRSGEGPAARIFNRRTVDQMTAPYFSRGGKVVRGLGWDIDSPYSSPRGKRFSEMSFGHTGYSGTSIWIDRESDLYVVLLTARTDYRRTTEFNRLRHEISTLASRIKAREIPELSDLTAR
ncbi:MAG TPA: serine hydrolase domain-containing protein [Verrucomicrobiae bacterium]|nr:serine hydrolase domain-containing protein [Verrucomicrobiae bacterium]